MTLASVKFHFISVLQTEGDVLYQERKELLSLDGHPNLPRIYKLCNWHVNGKEGCIQVVLTGYTSQDTVP